MDDEKFQYPGGNDLTITLNFMWQCQTRELAGDGMTAEYEDMLDHELLTLWPLAKEKDLSDKIWGLLMGGLDTIDPSEDRAGWGREKRVRCWNKKKLAMELAHEFRFLTQRTPDYSADMDDYQEMFRED